MNKWLGRLAVLAMAGMLSACYRDDAPAPIVNGPDSSLAPPAPVRQAPPALVETPGGRVVVRPGQTLYAISRETGTPVRSLIDANSLQPPYMLKAGQVLTIPQTRQYVVQPGDTLYRIARRNGVEASALVRTNHLDPPYIIKIGSTLELPPTTDTVSATPSQGPLPAAEVIPGAAPAPAASPGASFATAALPPLAASSPPPTAEVLPPIPTTKPAAPQKPPAAATPAPQVDEAAEQAEADQLDMPPEPETPVQIPAVAAAGAAPAPGAVSVATPPASVTAAVAAHRPPVDPIFYWPVRGRIVSIFGPAAAGTHNDGINIAAPAGTTVSAAESGEVAYAGNELRGFGNLLLIKHAGGWVTAYAHNDVLLVKKGDHIRRGQPIARVGNSGGVAIPQLHFELRQGTKAVDPLDHLPVLTSASG